MLHTIEVDQSRKIEQSGPTVLAFANKIAHAILIPQRVKRAGLHALRGEGKTKDEAQLILFAAGVYLLLENHLDQIGEVVIDVEYTGRERDIKSQLLRYIRRYVGQFDPEKIMFRRITKKSPADHKARNVRQKKDKDYRKITMKELLGLLA